MNVVLPRLVRVQDRLTVGQDAPPVWSINRRSAFLDARAGLSWIGTRKYQINGQELTVLHRPEQFTAPAFLRTIRRLPGGEGHPSGGRDILSTNWDELLVGYTGDVIDLEDCGGYTRPVGDATVFKPSTICKMVDEETWKRYCEDFPDVAKLGIVHDGAAPRTGTSLGYNALWYGPHVEAEIVSERDDGSLVGEWLGPHGPERYDIEHIVDPECEVVQRLAKNTGFDPRVLGGQHFAMCLAALGGRGAEQSELMRVVDSHDLPIDGDLARRFTRVALQVPLMRLRANVQPRIAQKWRDAVTQIFDEVGPVDPVWATRQAELSQILANNQPVPKCTINYGTNEFGVLETAFQFEGDPEPWTVVPALPLGEITREYIVDFYLWSRSPHDEVLAPGGQQLPECDPSNHEPEAARDALPQVPEKKTMNKLAIEIGIGREAAKALGKLGKQAPQSVTLTLDEVDGKAVAAKLGEMQALVGDLIEMVSEAKDEAAEAEAKTADMMPVAEAEKKVDEIKAMLAEAEKALAESKAAESKTADERDALKSTCDSLTAELTPFRAAEFKSFQDAAIARGFDKTKVEATKDAAQLRRLIATEKAGERYGKLRDDQTYVADDTLVQAAFDGVWGLLKPITDTNASAPSATFAGFPRVKPQRDDANTPANPTPASTTHAQVAAGLAAL